MNKLLLVDGHCLLFQMFYGMPARIIGKEGKPIQGTLGFVGAMRKILAMTHPTHVAVIFDGETHNPRTDLDADYKANREDFSLVADEDNPFLQLPDIYRALDYMGIAHTETTDCETDDVLASYAKAYGNDYEIVICSQDSDFFQLISENVSVLRYRGEKSVNCDVAYMREKFDISPDQYAFFKSLTGDGSDNIKGIPGIGPKTAAALVNQFSTPESLLQNADLIKQPKLRESIKQNADRLALNLKLITLDGCAAIPFLPKQMTFRPFALTTN
ncbi:MAG: flap endonuclease [Clostridia bacterium]|nr:flap endonuclease [Clostridia bacterium]